MEIDQANPKSKYDKDVEKQLCFNETMKNKVNFEMIQIRSTEILLILLLLL